MRLTTTIIAQISLLCSLSLASIRFPGIGSTHSDLNTIFRRDNTSAIAECGKDAAPGNETCPLGVCCSEYGNCGTTADFCGKGCQSGCDKLQRPACDGATASTKRTIGYYESWAINRKCQSVSPEELNITGFTHINYGFMLFDPNTFAIASADSNGTSLITRFTDLKSKNTGLKTWVAIGGWNFNEPGPTATAFSNMVGSPENRTKFAREIVSFMNTYAFDGLDIDWEYPSASDRGGKPADKQNLVVLTKDLRQAFGTKYGLSVTLPASYYYMRNFDVANMQEHVDFFNIMTYDLHGVWDKETKGMGPYLRPHTNITEIDEGLDMLWRAKVAPAKVNMGMAWYGRSFTLEDSKCAVPNGVCQFKEAALPGPCSDSAGILNLYEIQDILSSGSLTPKLDKTAAIKYTAYNQTQWVGYDDDDTIALKRTFAGSRCLGGTMVWAMDQANQKSACGLPAAVRPSGSNSTTGAAGQGNGTASCAGQTIAAPKKRAISRFNQSLKPRADNATCEGLSKQYSIATGTLQALTDPTCQIATDFCAPAACTLTQVSASTNCDSIVATAGNITCAQLQAWNPSVLGSWDALAPGQFVCTSPPGGWYVLAPPPPAPSPGAGASASASSSATLSASSVGSATITQPTIVGSDAPTMVPSATAGAGTETTVAGSASIGTSASASQPTTIGTDAPTMTSSGSMAAGTDAPSKTQSGIASDCNSFATATVGDTCIGFAAAHGIQPAQLYAWNAVLGQDGAACSTALWADESYCIGAGAGGEGSAGASGAATAPTESTAMQSSPAAARSAATTSLESTAVQSSPPAAGGATLVPTQLLPNSTSPSTDGEQTTSSPFATSNSSSSSS